MEETTSWKNHSFTLFIFGGIVVLCSIFFVLGMLMGRHQGQRLAEIAFKEEAAKKPAVSGTDEFPLNYASETTDAKPDLALQPPEPPPPPPRPAPAVQTRPAPGAKASVPTTPAPAPAAETFIQILATRDQKKASSELKRVQSKGFKARISMITAENAPMYRVFVGPYPDSEVSLAKADLLAKGYREVIVRR